MNGHVQFTDLVADLNGCHRFDTPTPRKPGQGHVYILELASGLVKVGRTKQPQVRVWELYRDEWVCRSITRAWLSMPHLDYINNEYPLLDFCRERASGAAGMEYFTGVTFDEIVAFAVTLDFDGPTRPRQDPRLMTLPRLASRSGYPLGTLTRLCRSGAVEHLTLPYLRKDGTHWSSPWRFMTVEQFEAAVAAGGPRKTPRPLPAVAGGVGLGVSGAPRAGVQVT